jgi:predicted dienelactone hydrolase
MALIVSACVLFAACSSGTASSSGSPASTATTIPESYDAGQQTVTYVDTSRTTPKNRDYAGSPERKLRTIVHYPMQNGAPATAGAPFPLILFSHGLTGWPELTAPLLADFARAGYVAVAPAYPLSNRDAPGGPTPVDLAQQPVDAKFVIDQVLAASESDGFLRGLVDGERIGAIGHSFGAMTTYGLVYGVACKDPRIKTAIVVSGVVAACDGKYFTGIDTPLLAIHGDHDEALPYDLGRDSWNRAAHPKYFMTMIDGTHSSDVNGGTKPGQRAVTDATIAWWDWHLKGDATASARFEEAASRAGISSLDAQP